MKYQPSVKRSARLAQYAPRSRCLHHQYLGVEPVRNESYNLADVVVIPKTGNMGLPRHVQYIVVNRQGKIVELLDVNYRPAQ